MRCYFNNNIYFIIETLRDKRDLSVGPVGGVISKKIPFYQAVKYFL